MLWMKGLWVKACLFILVLKRVGQPCFADPDHSRTTAPLRFHSLCRFSVLDTRSYVANT